ncbi:MAG: electron transfer flavoprotein subunit alpha/FixB family protein [Deltaproteobacteria bacterium]|nr:electron transfer flavoprotein subunit alpha/FixB family protein [Deltaproteobacteria bacterium]MBI3754755.1 electron transfer flavoprotein subunit alpha/FixB family protein [Deltaproteobacteria bacterium]
MNVWIIAEHKADIITDGTLEAIGTGRLISNKLNAKLFIVVLGYELFVLSKNLSNAGADNVYLLETPLLSQYTSDAYIGSLFPLIKQHQPSVILIPSTCNGRDLAPKLAAKLKTAYASDASKIDIDREIFFTRPAYGGRLLSTVTCRGEKPWIITLRPRAFGKFAGASKIAKIEKHAIDISSSSIRTMIKGFERTQKGVGLTEADIIISGGRGMKKAENFKMLEELAKILGGVVGASGAAVDAGWMPHSAQVGQTGKVVSPKLYIACGISGAPQHLAGMSTSKCIVAINKDPDAPIFKVADYGIAGDLFEVLPILIEELKR